MRRNLRSVVLSGGVFQALKAPQYVQCMSVIHFSSITDKETFHAHAGHFGTASRCEECAREERRDSDYFGLVADLPQRTRVLGDRL